jgi:ABC-type nitrate/sulfonate/bicarbonate transport system ATPase subunit
MSIGLSLSDVGRTFGSGAKEVVALEGVDFDAAPGEFIALIGPSGCGKSTVLRAIAGLDLAFTGSVMAGGVPVRGPSTDRGVVFQEHRLLPWLTVRENMLFGFEGTAAEREERLQELLTLMHLERFADAYPHQLSGGMAQRTSIARALAPRPDVLLMDEPFGALDAFTRIEMQDALYDVWRNQKATAVLVTHDIDEAIVLANRVVVMKAHPGAVRSIIDIDLEFPRDRTSDRFNEYRNELLAQFNLAHA